jgi:hypothetical protein
MLASRLFHTVVIASAALVASTAIACSGEGGGSSTSDSQTTEPSADGGTDGEAGVPDKGWAPTK